MLQSQIDRLFSDIASHLEAEPPRVSLVKLRLMAVAAVVAAISVGVALPDIHPALHVVWWVVGAPALVLAAVALFERTARARKRAR